MIQYFNFVLMNVATSNGRKLLSWITWTSLNVGKGKSSANEDGGLQLNVRLKIINLFEGKTCIFDESPTFKLSSFIKTSPAKIPMLLLV